MRPSTILGTQAPRGAGVQGGEGSWGADGCLQEQLRAGVLWAERAASPMVPCGFLPMADVGHPGEGGAAHCTLPPGPPFWLLGCQLHP